MGIENKIYDQFYVIVIKNGNVLSVTYYLV